MIKIYVTGVLKKDVRINTEELNFLKIKNINGLNSTKSFIDDGFGVIISNKKEFSKWVF